jgi:hypothetical protein
MLLPLLLVCVLSVFVGDPFGAAAGLISPASSNAALASAIAASLEQRSLPESLTPSLTDTEGQNVYSIQGTSFLKQSCDPYNFMKEALDPKPCIYGSVSAKRTIVIFGDSFVGNWLPALNDAGKNLGYRIAAFEFAGCITSFVPPTPGVRLTAFARACDEWHAHLPAAVQAQRPALILAANGTPSWGVQGDLSWIQGIQRAFKEMTTASPDTTRVIVSISPHLPEPAPSCLASYFSSIQKCNLTYKPGVLGLGLFSASLIRDRNAALASHAILLSTVQWFCLKDRCPAVVKNLLVYADADHVTTVYSEYLSRVLQKALVSILRHG